MAKVLLTFGALITLVFSSSLPLGARTSNSVENYLILPVTFTGVVEGHAYELNGTAEVRRSSYPSFCSLCSPSHSKFGLNSRACTLRLS